MTGRRNSAKILLVPAGIAHLVERHLAKVEVASSSLVARSSFEISNAAPFPACGRKTALCWKFLRFPSAGPPPVCRRREANTGLPDRGKRGIAVRKRKQKNLRKFKKRVDFFGRFAYNRV